METHDEQQPEKAQDPGNLIWTPEEIRKHLQLLALNSEDDKVRLRALELLLEQDQPTSAQNGTTRPHADAYEEARRMGKKK